MEDICDTSVIVYANPVTLLVFVYTDETDNRNRSLIDSTFRENTSL